MKRHLQVACAIIELNGKVLAAQRSERMTLPLKWEFPGGKIEEDETPGECLQRELREELGICVEVGAGLGATTHSYPGFTVTLHPFVCRMTEGVITLHEHNATLWVDPLCFGELDWATADLPVLDKYLELRDGAGGAR